MNTRVLCFVVAGFLAATSSSEACSCVELGEGPPSLAPYAAVFEGTVAAVREILIPLAEQDSYRPMRLVVFHAKRVWKGTKQLVFWLYTGQGGPDCGYPFELAEEYLVFAARPAPYERDELDMTKRHLVASLCSPTAPLSDAGELVSHLEEVANPWTPDFVVIDTASDPLQRPLP